MPSPCSCSATVRETWRGSPRYSDGPSRSGGSASTGGQASSTPGRCASSCVTAMRGLRFQMPDRPRLPEHVTLPLLTLVTAQRSEEHTSELQSLMRISYDVFCLKKKRRKQEI